MASRKTSGVIGIIAGIATGIYASTNIEQSGIGVMTVPVILFVLGVYFVFKGD